MAVAAVVAKPAEVAEDATLADAAEPALGE